MYYFTFFSFWGSGIRSQHLINGVNKYCFSFSHDLALASPVQKADESGVSKHPEILVFIKTRLPFAPRNLFNKIILPNYLFFEGISLLLLLKTALKVSFSSLSFKALSSYLESLHNLVASFRMSCLKQNIKSCFAFGKSLVLCEKT